MGEQRRREGRKAGAAAAGELKGLCGVLCDFLKLYMTHEGGGGEEGGERESEREIREFFRVDFFFFKTSTKKKLSFPSLLAPPPPMRVLFSSRATAQLQGANRRRLSGDGERS